MTIPAFFENLPKELAVPLIAAMPVLELRGAIPIGIKLYNLPVLEVYFLALLGNLLPVVPLLLFYKYFFHKLEKLWLIGKLFSWWFRRVEKKSKIVERWGFWGLVAFVAIPLPVTGAWTGTVAATLFEVRVRKAFPAIAIGVAIAGAIVSLVVIGILNIPVFAK